MTVCCHQMTYWNPDLVTLAQHTLCFDVFRAGTQGANFRGALRTSLKWRTRLHDTLSTENVRRLLTLQLAASAGAADVSVVAPVSAPAVRATANPRLAIFLWSMGPDLSASDM